MNMASSKWKGGDRHYDQLVKGSHKLHKDINELETAYMLHKQIVEEDQNSLRGMIRREVGGSRWAHGGAGKLTTYKSSKDLVDQENNVPNKGTFRSKQSSRDNHRLVQDNMDVPSSEINHSSINKSVDHDSKTDKILDLKTKVLKKASSHIIRRDTWAASEETKSVKDRNAANVKKNEIKQEVKKTSSGSKPQKPRSDKRSNSLKRENVDLSGSSSYVVKKAKDKQSNISSNSTKKNPSKESGPSQKDQSNRRSRLEIFNEKKRSDVEQTASLSSTEQQVTENGFHNSEKDNVLKPPSGMTYTPRKFNGFYENSGPLNDESKGFFSTQPPEPSEIFIDPKTCQVRVTAVKDDHFKDLQNLEGTRVLIQPGSVHTSVEGNRLTCSIVDEEVSDPNRKNEIRDIFGLDNFKTHTDDSVTFYKTADSSSPLTTAKQCNTEVEFWLRSLGIPDVNKYVRIFADNDIDLTDLEFMSASQLHDMGVTAFGALDKILKGIRCLKNQTFNKTGSYPEHKSKQLTSSSIAWEEVDDANRKMMSDSKHEASKKVNSCHSQTSVKESFDPVSFDNNARNFERSHSVLSNISESVDSARISARCETPNPSFAASTRSSSAKCVDKKRPPSAKNSSVKTSATNQSNGKNSNQSQIKTGSQSAVKLKRSNSAASEKTQPKMKNFENKPNKGVLLRPRSSSLTREASRLKSDQDLSVKKTEEKKEPQAQRQLRARSRSADVVKRKALEGVQAAAKKFVERKTKDTSKVFPPQDDKKKLRRDEMAARHIQREKYKEITTANGQSSDSDQDEQQQAFVDEDQSLQSLVTVNIMSPQKKTVQRDNKSSSTVIYVLPPINPNSAAQDDKPVTHVVRPQARRSLKGNRSRTGQSSVKPLSLHVDSNNEPPLLATYKIGNKDRDTRSQSEQESGYRTDGSTTYSQIEERVKDIQLKIKRLKARATSGDEMTLALVHDLQQQLLHFERQLKDKEGGNRSHRSDLSSNRGSLPNTNESKASDTPRTPLSTARQSVNASTQSTCDTDHSNTETSTVTTVIQRVPETGAASRNVDEDSLTDGVRMSKQELLDEMRKEKQQHHLQIIQLQSELQRFKHAGPVSSMELDPREICYKVEDTIGEGTFSRVYKGEYQGSEVAVKQLKLPLQQQDKNYFAAEVSLLKELRHPRVVLLIGVCTTSKLPLMVLEYMSRGSLHDYLHNPECDSLDHALYYQVARDIASGMNYLHSHKPEVLHLDLKSMNVLLCQSLRAKIADFGFSKLRLTVDSKSGRKGRMKTSTNVPAWMSPELIDKGEITGKSDVYSFGIILWEMLTRSDPYKGFSVFQVLEMVRRKRRPEIPTGTPEGLAHLISLCWDHNPAKRPQFKDVLQILENLAFPPAWRELFQKAGVPDSALQDVNSTRTIISLVSGTLDSGKSSILHSFMVAHSKKGSNSARSKHQEKNSARSTERASKRNNKKDGKLCVSNSKENKAKVSSRSSNQISDWDSDVISSLSDESEITLKNLRSSSNESEGEYDSDESSILSSDDQSLVSRNKENETASTKKALNVVIPNLELSIQSARDELRAERQRITGSPDWLSISLDDRTQRTGKNQSSRTSRKTEDSELRLSLKSALSTSPTPPCHPTEEVVANESARSRRRNKSRDLTRYSEEFLRRESFHNRRPPSPKKKTPLTKKLLDSPDGSPSLNRMSLNEMKCKNEKQASNLKKDSFVEKSYDSFFGLSSHEPSVNVSAFQNDEHVEGNRHSEDVDFESHLIRALKSEPGKVNSNTVPLGRKSISNKDEICVEDMENEVELEMLRQETNTESKSTDSNLETISGSESYKIKVKVDSSNEIVKYSEGRPVQKSASLVRNISETATDKDQFKEKLKASLKCLESKTETKTNTPVFNSLNSEPVKSSAKQLNSSVATSNDIDKQDEISKKQMIPELRESSEKNDIVPGSTEVKFNQTGEEKELMTKQMPGKVVQKSLKVEESKRNDIRVVLNEMLNSKDYVAKPNPNLSKKSTEVKITDASPRNSGAINDPSTKDTFEEEIRVKLNLEEVSKKRKKPEITPRKSIKAKSINAMIQREKTSSDIDKNGSSVEVCHSQSVNIPGDTASVPGHKSNDCNNSSHENQKAEHANSGKIMNQNHKLGHYSTGESGDLNHEKGELRSVEDVDQTHKKDHLSTAKTVYNTAKLSKSQTHGKIDTEKDRQRSKHHSRRSENSFEDIPSPKKKTIRVKLKKDPLVPQLAREMSSPIPPAPPPPPPPVPVMSQSVQEQAPRSSIADEIKLRVANRQSVSEGMLRNNKILNKQNSGPTGRNILVPRPVDNGPKLMNIAEMDETLTPQQSDGLPFMVQSLELRDQKGHLRSISKPHPKQLDDLSNASHEQLSSIADILKKAVMNRRLAMGEDGDSVSQSLESAATGWSVDC